MAESRSHRLPTSVIPERYEIRLTPDLTQWTFAGDVKIALQVVQAVSVVVLNAAELSIQSVSMRRSDGAVLHGSAQLDDENEQAVLSFPETLAPGPYSLQIQFTGVLNDKLHGFYRSVYKGADGQDKPLASTQFESTDARRAFPCWDEPAFKAVYQVTLVVDEKLTAISNARVVRETAIAGTGKKAVVFADSYEDVDLFGRLHRRRVRRHVAGDGRWRTTTSLGRTREKAARRFRGCYRLRRRWNISVNITASPIRAINWILIAIPDFASGAMENLGAITFRETALLVDAEKATRAELERVADVVSHENAHMWFGDLVTMQWWNGLWLNEAFATFMEMLAVDAWKPEWRRWDSFTVSRAAAMQVDGLKSTRPIEFPSRETGRSGRHVRRADLRKRRVGAAHARAVSRRGRFRDGIDFICSGMLTPTPRPPIYGMLWKSRQKQPVRALMDTWIFQPGYPLISVEQSGGTIRILAANFSLPARRLATDERSWHVPVFLRAGHEGRRG